MTGTDADGGTEGAALGTPVPEPVPCPHAALGVPDATLSALLVDACAAPLALVDRCGHLLRVNTAFLRLAGRVVTDVVGRSVEELLPLDGGVRQAADLAVRMAAGRPADPPEQLWVDEFGNRRRIAWTFTGAPSGRAAVYLIATGADVTRERQAEASWRERAQTDALTGLANRTALDAVLAAQLGPRGTGCGILFCDLDGFKSVNDTYGHAVGDQVLVEIAHRLAGSVRGNRGDVIARVGGDEFVIVLPSVGELALRAVVPRVEQAVARPLRLDAGVIRVGVSIGTRVADPGEDPAGVLRDADRLMYAAKSLRRRRSPAPSA